VIADEAGGYSGTPLARKLGIPGGMTVALIDAPPDFPVTLDPPEGVTLRTSLRGPAEVIVCFTTRRADLSRRLPALQRALPQEGGLWIAWPKRGSGVSTDVTENALRELILPTGLVDNKVCAIDETWSGLRFVVRLANRAARAGRRRSG
jgi:hypothetical protein